MNFSKKLSIVLSLFAFLTAVGVSAQMQLVNSILPPDHLLENLPWLGEDGKTESKGLFDFEDFRGLGAKDVILIYRQSAPVSALDKPHNQTLAVYFFDTPSQKYVKGLEDEGGPIHWVKLLSEPDWKSPVLVVLRDDLQGHQVIEGYTCVKDQMKRVLDAQAPQIYVFFPTGSENGCVWVSSQEQPKNASAAEHVFVWDKNNTQLVEASYKGIAGWAGESILLPTPTAVPVQVAKVSQPVSHPSANGWWDEPFDANKSFGRLKTELVPQLIQKNQIAVLGQKATAFFKEVQKNGVKGKAFAAMRSGYYAAVATTLFNMNKAKDAAFYLKIALSYQSDNADALALKAKIK